MKHLPVFSLFVCNRYASSYPCLFTGFGITHTAITACCCLRNEKSGQRIRGSRRKCAVSCHSRVRIRCILQTLQSSAANPGICIRWYVPYPFIFPSSNWFLIIETVVSYRATYLTYDAFFSVVRSSVPKIQLDHLFEAKDDIAHAVRAELSKVMVSYSREIHCFLRQFFSLVLFIFSL